VPRLKQVSILVLAISLGFSSTSHAAPSQSETERDSLVTIKIVNGSVKPISYSPWQVALINASKSSNFQGQFCGGSVISREWIVTAAHCVDGDTTINSFRVLAGTATLSSTTLSGNFVNSIVIHPGWNPVTDQNDIALVQLKVPLVLNAGTIETIEIPNTKAASGTTARITGWGSLLKRLPSADLASDYLYPSELVGAEIFVNSDADCTADYTIDSSTYFYADSMLCANDMETNPAQYIDTCQGDSGGPLATNDSGIWYLSGITSWGYGCAQGYAGIYTNVANYNSWISTNAVDNRFRVAFNSKGGSSVSASSFATSGSVSTPASPSRSGYTFAGWALTDGGAKLTFPYTPGTAADFTLFAKWIKRASASIKPTLSGTAKVNKTLTAKKGTWSGIPTPAISYQWYACSKAVSTVRTTIPSTCKSISGANKSTLKLKQAQKGKYLAVRVTGKSSGTSGTPWLTKSTKKVK
jgi:uncharacterized repeat protein (TIGR02543 family)